MHYLPPAAGGFADFFPATVLDANGDAALSLSRPPLANRVIAMCAGSSSGAAALARVLSVVGSTVTVRVQRAKTPTLAHAPTTDANALKATGAPANVTADDVGTVTTDPNFYNRVGVGVPLNNCGSALCDAQSLDGGGVAKATAVTAVPVTARTDLVQASGASKFAAMTAVADHAATNLPAAASETVDLVVLYGSGDA